MTITERLILSNQYKILAFLDADNRKQYNELAENITDGYGFLYSDIFSPISQELSEVLRDKYNAPPLRQKY